MGTFLAIFFCVLVTFSSINCSTTPYLSSERDLDRYRWSTTDRVKPGTTSTTENTTAPATTASNTTDPATIAPANTTHTRTTTVENTTAPATTAPNMTAPAMTDPATIAPANTTPTRTTTVENTTAPATTAPATIAPETTTHTRTSTVASTACVESCVGKSNGNYQYCKNCHEYVACSNSIMYIMQCPASLVWDDVQKECDWTSSTC